MLGFVSKTEGDLPEFGFGSWMKRMILGVSVVIGERPRMDLLTGMPQSQRLVGGKSPTCLSSLSVPRTSFLLDL